MQITIKDKEKQVAHVVEFDMPEDVNGLIEKWGSEITYDFARRSITLAIQALVRQHLAEDPATFQSIVNNWQPGVRQRGVKKTAFEKASATLGQLSAEELAELLEKVKAAKKAAQ